MVKPTVHYVPHKDDAIFEGERAVLHNVVDHPNTRRVSNTPGKLVFTSTVVAVGEGGAFETINTQYVPGERPKVRIGEQ